MNVVPDRAASDAITSGQNVGTGPCIETKEETALLAPFALDYRRCYLLLSLIFGLLLICLTPLGQVGDEFGHFLRAYQLCRLHLVGSRHGPLSSGGNFPVAVALVREIGSRFPGQPERKLSLDEYRGDWQLHVDPDLRKRVYVDFHACVMYSPAGYLPQVFGIKLAELFSDRLLTMFYLARLCNLLAGVALGWLALRVAPCAHASICALALSPMAFFQMSSASADVMTNGCAILYFALVLRAAVGGVLLKPLDYLGLLASLFVVSQVKAPYLALTALLLIIPATAFGSARRKYLAVAAIGGICCAGYLVWYKLTQGATVPGRPDVGSNVPAQVGFVLHHPLQFGLALIRTVQISGPENIRQFLGVLGWLDTPLPLGFRAAFGAFLLVTFAWEEIPRRLLGVAMRFWALTATVGSIVLCLLFIYLYWDAIGADWVAGFQGRYLIAAALPLVLVLNCGARFNTRDATARLVCTKAVMTLSLTVTLITVAKRFYPI